MQSTPSAFIDASCLSLSLDPYDVGSHTSPPKWSLTDEDHRPDAQALEVTYPNLSSKVGDTSASILRWEHATPIIPSTPRRYCPNIGKRRGNTPDLSRSAKSLSHSTKMAKLFQEASAGLQETTTIPPRHMPANTRRSRLPLLQHMDRVPLNIVPIGADSSFRPQLIGCPSKVRPEPTMPTPAAPTPPAIPDDQPFPSPIPYNDTPSVAKSVTSGHWDPPSSGFEQSAATMKEVSALGSDLDTRLRDFPSSPPVVSFDVDDGECHSSHGVPLIIPVPHLDSHDTKRFFIEAWLDQVPNSPDEGTACEPQLPRSGGDDQEDIHHATVIPQAHLIEEAAISALDRSSSAPSRASSNKENIHPLSSPLAGRPATLTPLPSSSPQASLSSALCPIETPSRTKLPFTSSSASRFQHPFTPRGLFAVAPTRRKKDQPTASRECNGTRTNETPRVVENRTSPVPFQARELHRNSAFDIHEDLVEPDDVQLSPAVTCFRKGRGPKRAKARCASYYDTDILGENISPISGRGDLARGKRKMGKERRVLGTHDEGEEMCTPRAFVEEAEGAAFEYRLAGEASGRL